MDAQEIEALFSQCTRSLSGHGRRLPQQVLAELAEWTPADLPPDRYGSGELITGFEEQVAALLGKEAAVFMPSGTMCQQIALRLWADRRGSRHVAFHPTCHLEIHEQQAYQLLHGLHGILAGTRERLLTLDDLRHITEPLGALLLELPQREIGSQLPPWEDLVAICEWARSQHIPLHMDGARLWECKPFYAREYAEIAALFDSVYVSFYKGLGGIAGAILAGPHDLIAEARVWQRRHGGNLFQLYPYVLSARKGLEERLPCMQAYHDKAVEIAGVLKEFPEITFMPDPPHTNMLHIFVRGDKARLEAALVETMRATGMWLFYPLRPSQVPGCHVVELSTGDATLELETAEIADLFREVMRRAAGRR